VSRGSSFASAKSSRGGKALVRPCFFRLSDLDLFSPHVRGELTLDGCTAVSEKFQAFTQQGIGVCPGFLGRVCSLKSHACRKKIHSMTGFWPSFQHPPLFDTLRNNCKTDASVNAIDGEVVAIHCEDPSDAFSLSHSNEGGVREIHRVVGKLGGRHT
jgi:hypothetical protein